MKRRNAQLESNHAVSVKRMEMVKEFYSRNINDALIYKDGIYNYIMDELNLSLSDKGKKTLMDKIEITIKAELSKTPVYNPSFIFSMKVFIDKVLKIVYDDIHDKKFAKEESIKYLPEHQISGVSLTMPQIKVQPIKTTGAILATNLQTIGGL